MSVSCGCRITAAAALTTQLTGRSDRCETGGGLECDKQPETLKLWEVEGVKASI